MLGRLTPITPLLRSKRDIVLVRCVLLKFCKTRCASRRKDKRKVGALALSLFGVDWMQKTFALSKLYL
jgi:hypothetical protein